MERRQFGSVWQARAQLETELHMWALRLWHLGRMVYQLGIVAGQEAALPLAP